MSEEVQEASVISEISGVDAEMDWDNIEETAPSIEASEKENEIEEIEENKEESDDSSSESKDEDTDSSDEPATEESHEDTDAKKETDKDAEEAPEEVTEEKIDPKLEEAGLSLHEGQIGKMVTVDGEEVFVNLKELGNDYSGQKAIAKRFNEYNVKEKEFTTQMSEVNEYINDLGATMRDSSILGGVEKIAELVGFPPHQLREALFKELMPEVERRYGLSEEELALEQKSEENSYLSKQIESDGSKLQQEQAQRELDAKVLDLRETHNISRQEWQDAETTLLENDFNKEDVTPELVVKYKNFQQAESRATSLLEKFDSSYLENADVVDALVDEIFGEPSLTDDDINDILEEALGSAKKVKAEEKVKTAVEAKQKAKPTKESDQGDKFSKLTTDEGNEIEDWDDFL